MVESPTTSARSWGITTQVSRPDRSPFVIVLDFELLVPSFYRIIEKTLVPNAIHMIWGLLVFDFFNSPGSKWL